jgi:hypothetical protein
MNYAKYRKATILVNFSLIDKEIEYKTYENICYSIKGHEYDKEPNKDYSFCTLGQMHHLMEEGWQGWWSNYFIKSNAA